MLPYFYKLSNRLISDELSAKLTEFSMSNLNLFTEHSTDTGIRDGNNYLYGDRLQKIDEIKELKKSCSLDFYVILYMHKPNAQVIKHVDNPKYRKTNLIHPLFPTTNYAPTDFYEDDKVVCQCEFNDQLPVFLNLSKYHGLFNSDSIRLNLQFAFQEDFQTVITLYQKGQLFQT